MAVELGGTVEAARIQRAGAARARSDAMANADGDACRRPSARIFVLEYEQRSL
jgi:hypothetical protein